MKATLRPRARVPKRLRPALRRGAKVEMEHTRSKRTAEVIASHHLAEFGARYYPALAKMERKLARGNPGLNAAFHRWFGKSVLTTKDGQPLPLYHGTTTEVNFDKFKVSDGNYGQGIYLAPAWHADKYAEGHGGRLIPVFARVERPLIVDFNMNDPGYKVWSDKIVASPERRASGMTVGKWLQHLGYDGVIVTDNGKINMVNVLSPKQVKSIHNKGTWSRRSSVLLNPITAAPDKTWADAQLVRARDLLNKSDADNSVVMQGPVWEHGYLHLILVRSKSQGGTWWRWIYAEIGKAKVPKVVGTGSLVEKQGVLVVDNSVITKPYRKMGLYPHALRAIKKASSLKVVSSTARSKAAQDSWKKMGGVLNEEADRWELQNPALGNDPNVFRLTHARRLLERAIVESGGDPTNADQIEDRAYELALHKIQEIGDGKRPRIVPMRERGEIRISAILMMAQMLASGEIHGRGPRRNPGRRKARKARK